jgi:hypothetical protein
MSISTKLVPVLKSKAPAPAPVHEVHHSPAPVADVVPIPDVHQTEISQPIAAPLPNNDAKNDAPRSGGMVLGMVFGSIFGSLFVFALYQMKRRAQNQPDAFKQQPINGNYGSVSQTIEL